MRAVVVFLFYTLLSCFNSFGQLEKDTTGFPQIVGLRVNYSYSKIQHFDIGVALGNIISAKEAIGPLGFHDAFINVGYGFSKDNSVMTTKVGYELMTVLPGFRLSLINYTDFKKHQTCVLPEVGLTYASLIYIMYGYNINLNRKDYLNAKGHVLSLGLTVPFYLIIDRKFIWKSWQRKKKPSLNTMFRTTQQTVNSDRLFNIPQNN
jgi:hypothetical protein